MTNLKNSLAIVLFPLVLGATLPAAAQVTINSTGIVSGTIAPPNRNPTFNQGTTRVDTDSQGRYFRNGVLVYSAQDYNPNLVRVDSNGRYFVDFRGIPVVSPDGNLTSPVLSNGQLELTPRFNHNAPVRFWGNIQDEFVVQGRYTGTAIDPTTGQQYQGTFTLRGQGPRYSDSNGGSSPTVFDFRSHYNFQANPALPPTPTVSAYSITAMPVRLTITIPAGLLPTPAPTGTVPVGSPPAVTPISTVPLPTSSPGGSNPVLSSFGDRAGFEVNRAVLESASSPGAIGPKSRVLLR